MGHMLIKYRKIIRESLEDFGFVNNIPELHGVKFKDLDSDTIFTVIDIGFRSYVDVTWVDDDGEPVTIPYLRHQVIKQFTSNRWVIQY